MSGNLCDRRPCRRLGAITGLLDFQMHGESNEDLRATLIVSAPSAPEAHRVTLFYCPFCGMRLDDHLVEGMQRSRSA